MKYKLLIKLSVLLFTALLMWGCFEDHASQFHLDDANQVEWAPPDRSSSSLTYTATLEPGQTDNETITFEVQLIGAQSGADRTVGVEATDGDAVEGTDFEILNSNNEVVIPANSNSGTVEVQILAANIEDGESISAILELQEGPELGVAVNMKDLVLTIEKEEPGDDD